MSLILVTGNATLDVVDVVSHYPLEDEELRAVSQWMESGGNAANTAKILAQYRHRCDFAGAIADDVDGQRIRTALLQQQVGLDYAVQQAGSSPVSHITLNQQNGSRTIVHHRQLPELTAQAFAEIPVGRYDWLHFEGRNVPELAGMLAHAREHLVDQPISLEVEKVRDGLEALIPHADLVMFSRAYALAAGFADAASFLHDRQARHGAGWMTCTWGHEGAWAVDQYGEVSHAPAAPVQVVDTVGAGDTFNAGLIHALVTGQPLESALQSAVALAGRKVQQQGLAGLLGRGGD